MKVIYNGKPDVKAFKDVLGTRIPEMLEMCIRDRCYHHHMGTVVQTAAETDRLLANTDADKVFLCYDTGHFTFAGEDPLAVLKKYVSRVGHVHLKDMRADVVALSLIHISRAAGRRAPARPSMKGVFSMKLKWYGHSCFSLTFANGTAVVTDPFDETVGYPLCTARADIALLSHCLLYTSRCV